MVFRADKYTAIKKKQDVYSDFLNNMNFHPGNKQLVRAVNEEAVKKSIRNLILTNRYERLYNPNLGGDVRAFLFDNVGPETEVSIKDAIKTTIGNYEPRAQIIDVIANVRPDDNAYDVSILFYITTNPDPITLELTLYRVR